MALSVKVSNSLEQLIESFSSALRQEPGDVFQPTFIITQTEGMNNWLKMRISALNGIAANFRFVKPNDILYQVYFRLEGPREQVLSSDNLQWILYRELDSPLFKKRFPEIARYYEDGAEVKRLGLAQRVADLFDQYQVYRPGLINDWNAGRIQAGPAQWQAWLWTRVGTVLGPLMEDKTAMAEFITGALGDPERAAMLRQRLPRVYLFGLSILTAFHIDLFYHLSTQIDIGFYVLNPAPSQYWYEDKSPRQIARWKRRPGHERFAVPELGNTLLTHWGKVIQDTFSLLFRHEAFLDRYDDTGVTEPLSDSLLHKIQRDLFHNAVGKDRQPLTAADILDGSISFNACYTPAREVEVLYNYLVHLVDAGKLTSPRDVVVMVNDINTYAPYIRAVFDAAPYRFAYSIADEYLAADQGFFGALQAIMNLEEEDFKAETILALLEFDLIRERFGITRPELIRRAVDEANIRFGIYGSEADESVTLSWVNGLKRIMYGICMLGGGEYTGDGYGFYPLDIEEGEGALDLIRFTHLMEVVIGVTEARKKPRPLSAWSLYLEDSVEALVVFPSHGDDPDYALMQQHLEKLKMVSETMEDPINFRVFRESFISQMASETRQGNFIGGGITFCSLIPMRSIPFKTIAMLGLNFDAFPRKEKQVPFDLIKLHPAAGDRSVRGNDKHLFLETLLSAQERLYISYIGKSPKDAMALPPSALVDELMDYIKAGSAGAGVPLTVHPLHGFSTRYGDGHDLYTYWGSARTSPEIPALPPEASSGSFEDVDAGTLINFFKNPFKFYYNKILGIYYREDALLLEDSEVFELDKLQEWSLKNDLVFLEPEATGAYRDQQVKRGLLPLRQMADLEIGEAAGQVRKVREWVSGAVGDATREFRSLKLTLGDTVLSGEIPVYGAKLLTISFSKNESKYCLETYLRHLIASAAGWAMETHFISGRTGEDILIAPDKWSPREAADRLTTLLEYYKQGHEQVLAYSPELRIDMREIGTLTEEEFHQKIAGAFKDGRGISDPYLRREYENGFFEGSEVFASYQEIATSVYAPVYEIFKR